MIGIMPTCLSSLTPTVLSTAGLRKSQSTSSTDLPFCASAQAMLVETVVLPSSSNVLVMANTLLPLSDARFSIFVRIALKLSTKLNVTELSSVIRMPFFGFFFFFILPCAISTIGTEPR